MRSLDHILPTIMLSAILPVSVASRPVTEMAAAPWGGASTEVAEESVAGASNTSLSEFVRGFVSRLLGYEHQPPAPSDQDIALAEQVLRARSLVDSAPQLTFARTDKVEKFVEYYSQGRGHRTMRIGVERSHGMRERAEEIFAEEGIPPRLIWLAQVESVWKNEATSHAGASGIWQFMPATAARFGMTRAERHDFEKATRAAAKYLRWLNKRYDGDWALAIGAYNCGEGNMDKAIARAGVKNFWKIVERDLLPDETQEYVPKVLAASIVGPEVAGPPRT